MQTDNIVHSIPYLEHYAMRKDYHSVFAILKELLNFHIKGNNLEGQNIFTRDGEPSGIRNPGFPPLQEDHSLEIKSSWYHRIATSVTAYLSDPTYHHSHQELAYINLLKPLLQDIFYISDYGSMDHILWHRGIIDGNNQLDLNQHNAIEYLIACHTIHSGIKVDYRKLMATMPDIALDGYIGIMTQFSHPFDDKATQNFNELFEQHSIMAEHPNPKIVHISRIIPGWMGCSYWDIPNRHEFKRNANKMIKKWLDKNLQPGTKKILDRAPPAARQKKRIVIASEKYTHKHAMYRCYHSRIASLRENYELILVSAEDDFDGISRRDFDKTIIVKDEISDINNTIKLITNLNPDVILFPSLGMATWTILLCNLRLAPTQIMSYGHPASACSKTVDYGVIGAPENTIDYQQFLDEKLLPYRLKTMPYSLHPEYSEKLVDQYPVNKNQGSQEDTVKIAINGSLPKISLRLINLCKILESESSEKLEFHFFPASNRGAKFTAFNKSLGERLKSRYVVYPVMPYQNYIKSLSRCDLAIGTFPFGGSNTNVDTLMLGLPKVIFTERSDIASFTDLHEFEAWNLAELLNTESEISLVSKCLYLIANHNDRKIISEKIKNLAAKERYESLDDDRSQFVNAINSITEA